MSWIQKLYETYEQCFGRPELSVAGPMLEPICHTSQQAHIEVTLDGNGRYLRANVVPKGQGVTLVPCTEASAGRSGSRPVNHPLCDKLQYLAGDFLKYGGVVTSGYSSNPGEPYDAYLTLLSEWANSPFAHPKLVAVLTYVQNSGLVSDLVHEKLLPVGEDGQLLAEWCGEKSEAPAIFGIMPGGNSPDGAVVRWRVEIPGDLIPETWKDRALIESWIGYYTNRKDAKGLCMVTGDNRSLAEQHPAKLRHGADKAKFISSNDTSGYTFRGRFINADQACGVGFEVTQKAHNALRWLIARQAYRNGDQAVVAWAVSGKRTPDPLANTFDFLEMKTDGAEAAQGQAPQGEMGQAFSFRLKKKLEGYHAELGATSEIVIMALDSATPGRMAITYYRELGASELLDRVEAWHTSHAWHQNFGKEMKFIGVPAPKDIAEAAFGRRLDEKLRKATVERLLPCIVDGLRVPRDLLESTLHRASNRVGLEHWEWEKNLGIACALFKGYYKERDYQMALEDRRTRDYLYGRLLAIAEHVEDRALFVGGEKRDTSAAKLMQRFADHPFSTWRSIELSLSPYKTRLRAKRPGFLATMENQIDEVVAMFQGEDFMNDNKLSGEFLLAYHCQRQALRAKPDPEHDEHTEPTIIEAN